MKNKIKSVVLVVSLTFVVASVAASAQTIESQRERSKEDVRLQKQQSNSVWTIDFIKSKPGQQTNLLKFVEQNWATARQMLKEKGDVISYKVLSLPASEKVEWDVLLLTEYAKREVYDQREAIFAEVFKLRPTVPVNGMTSGRQMADIKNPDGITYAQPISSETAKIMLETQTTNPEIAAARVPLENYLKGHETGNPEFMRRAFHAEGKLIFIRDGKYSTWTFEEYIARMTGKPAEDEAKRKRYIESVDVAGNAAVGKIILDYPTVKFVDYMTLLKIDGEWKIVNKSFYAEPKTQLTNK